MTRLRLALVLFAAGSLAACGGPNREAVLAQLDKLKVDEALKDAKLHASAIEVGKGVYEENCQACHGPDLKGVRAQHTPDLTDAKWIYAGDDLDTFEMHPSDIERTVLFGIRSGHAKARNEAIMPGRGAGSNLTPAEIDQVAEFTLQLAGQKVDAAKAALGRKVYDGKGGCYDCHATDGVGDSSIGSADLTQPATWLYGADRASLMVSLTDGRAGVCPSFEGKLKPAEIKAVSLYVFAAGKKTAS